MKDVVDRISAWLEDDDELDAEQTLRDARAEIIGLRAKLEQVCSNPKPAGIANRDNCATGNNRELDYPTRNLLARLAEAVLSNQFLNFRRREQLTAAWAAYIKAKAKANAAAEPEVTVTCDAAMAAPVPVAWAVLAEDYEYVSLFKESAEAAAGVDGDVVPLYSDRQPALTDEERNAIKTAEGGYFAWKDDNDEGYSPERLAVSETLRKLLERL